MWNYVLIVSPLKIIPGLRKDLRVFSFFIPCKNLQSTLMEVLHALKGRIDSLFQKNNQDKGEFWFHFVKFKGKLNSGRERRVRERERRRAPNNFLSCLLIASNLKIFYCFLANKSGICIRKHVAIWSLGDGLFICIPWSWMSCVWSTTNQKRPTSKKYNIRDILSVHVRRKCPIKEV